MTTLQTTTSGDERSVELRPISRGEFSYVCKRNQHQAHDLLLRAFRDSPLSQKDLSHATGIDEATISRILKEPRNIELNTFSKLIYGMCNGA